MTTDTLEPVTVHPSQMELFEVWRYELPFVGLTPWDWDYEDIDQRYGGNDNPYQED